MLHLVASVAGALDIVVGGRHNHRPCRKKKGDPVKGSPRGWSARSESNRHTLEGGGFQDRCVYRFRHWRRHITEKLTRLGGFFFVFAPNLNHYKHYMLWLFSCLLTNSSSLFFGTQ